MQSNAIAQDIIKRKSPTDVPSLIKIMKETPYGDIENLIKTNAHLIKNDSDDLLRLLQETPAGKRLNVLLLLIDKISPDKLEKFKDTLTPLYRHAFPQKYEEYKQEKMLASTKKEILSVFDLQMLFNETPGLDVENIILKYKYVFKTTMDVYCILQSIPESNRLNVLMTLIEFTDPDFLHYKKALLSIEDQPLFEIKYMEYVLKTTLRFLENQTFEITSAKQLNLFLLSANKHCIIPLAGKYENVIKNVDDLCDVLVNLPTTAKTAILQYHSDKVKLLSQVKSILTEDLKKMIDWFMIGSSISQLETAILRYRNSVFAVMISLHHSELITTMDQLINIVLKNIPEQLRAEVATLHIDKIKNFSMLKKLLDELPKVQITTEFLMLFKNLISNENQMREIVKLMNKEEGKKFEDAFLKEAGKQFFATSHSIFASKDQTTMPAPLVSDQKQALTK